MGYKSQMAFIMRNECQIKLTFLPLNRKHQLDWITQVTLPDTDRHLLVYAQSALQTPLQ